MDKQNTGEILKKLGVEKVGAEKSDRFDHFIKELGDKEWFFLVCEVEGYSFLIVSEKTFAQREINHENSNEIKLLNTAENIETAMIYASSERIRVFWFDYGYFVFG